MVILYHFEDASFYFDLWFFLNRKGIEFYCYLFNNCPVGVSFYLFGFIEVNLYVTRCLDVNNFLLSYLIQMLCGYDRSCQCCIFFYFGLHKNHLAQMLKRGFYGDPLEGFDSLGIEVRLRIWIFRSPSSTTVILTHVIHRPQFEKHNWNEPLIATY